MRDELKSTKIDKVIEFIFSSKMKSYKVDEDSNIQTDEMLHIHSL